MLKFLGFALSLHMVFSSHAMAGPFANCIDALSAPLTRFFLPKSPEAALKEFRKAIADYEAGSLLYQQQGRQPARVLADDAMKKAKSYLQSLGGKTTSVQVSQFGQLKIEPGPSRLGELARLGKEKFDVPLYFAPADMLTREEMALHLSLVGGHAVFLSPGTLLPENEHIIFHELAHSFIYSQKEAGIPNEFYGTVKAVGILPFSERTTYKKTLGFDEIFAALMQLKALIVMYEHAKADGDPVLERSLQVSLVMHMLESRAIAEQVRHTAEWLKSQITSQGMRLITVQKGKTTLIRGVIMWGEPGIYHFELPLIASGPDTVVNPTTFASERLELLAGRCQDFEAMLDEYLSQFQ